MRSTAPVFGAIGATLASWGVSEWNQVAGAFAFGAAGVYSVVKVAFLVIDRNKPKK